MINANDDTRPASFRSTGMADEYPPADEMNEAFGPAEWTPESIEDYEAWLTAQSLPTAAQQLQQAFAEVDARDDAMRALFAADATRVA